MDLGLVPGEVFDESRLHKRLEDLKGKYDIVGYVNFRAQPMLDFDEQKKVVNVTVNIDEGLRLIVNRISFIGNTNPPDEVIRREILLKEGQVFRPTLLDRSLLQLNQLGLFEEIKAEDVTIKQTPPYETKVDIEIKLKEKGH